MSDQTYNGWTNYETWNVKLWIDNDEGSQQFWLKRAEQLKDDRHSLAEQLNEHYRYDVNPLIDRASMYNDLLGSALDNVDWLEIADALIEDAEEIL